MFVKVIIKCSHIDIDIWMRFMDSFTPSGAATRHTNLMLFALRFLRLSIARIAEPPVANIGSTKRFGAQRVCWKFNQVFNWLERFSTITFTYRCGPRAAGISFKIPSTIPVTKLAQLLISYLQVLALSCAQQEYQFRHLVQAVTRYFVSHKHTNLINEFAELFC